MSGYRIIEGTAEERRRVRDLLFGLDLVPPVEAERIVTAWVSTWRSGVYADPTDIPSLPSVPSYRLVDHTHEVLVLGLDLAERFGKEKWYDIDQATLVATILLHDIDKALIFARVGDRVEYAPLAQELPHGVIAALLLRELGFSDPVVNVVATHARNAPFHGLTANAFILHYADMIATDRVHLAHGVTPFYQPGAA